VDKFESNLDEKLNAVSSSSTSATKASDYESLLERITPPLHPNHYLAMRVKSRLISQYGNVPGLAYQVLFKGSGLPYFFTNAASLFIQTLSMDLLLRKKHLCEEFLSVYSKIDAGSSEWRGCTLFELAMTRAELAQR
jgi:hypothetical protein